MIRTLARPTWSLAALLSVAAPTALAGGSAWLTDYDEALEDAEKKGRPILIEFVESETCEDSMALERTVFRKSDFRRWSKKNVVLLSVDFPERKYQSDELKAQNAELKERFGVEEFPTVVLLGPLGDEAGRVGFGEDDDPGEWLDDLKQRAEDARGAGGWLTDFERAKRLARSTRRPILADFTGSDWCGWCIKLKEEVFDTPEFEAWARKNVVLLEIDFPRRSELPAELKAQNDRLQQEYEIQGFPTILFLDADGEVLGRSGYKEGGPKAWCADAEQQME